MWRGGDSGGGGDGGGGGRGGGRRDLAMGMGGQLFVG